ncbi:MAG: ribonuclease III [Lactobacillus sp.]|nr:ribonuclease III [Lactobacillus sp.]
MLNQTFLDRLKKDYHIEFKNLDLLKQALTHSSYANEHPHWVGNYEKLEFLGDAVLELAISDYLYRNFRDLHEGELTRFRSNIVRTEGFSKFAEELGLKDQIFLGKGEENNGSRNRKALLEDVFEAFNGALYLDQGMDKVVDFLKIAVFPHIQQGEFNSARDYKSELQEQLQVNGSVEISYEVTNSVEVPPFFEVQLVINGQKFTKGTGSSKKKASQEAAKKYLEQQED